MPSLSLLSKTVGLAIVLAGSSVLVSGKATAEELDWASDAFGDGFESSAPRAVPARRTGRPATQYTFGPKAFPALLEGGPRPVIKPMQPERIAFAHNEAAGTILIDTDRKRLYYTLASNEAYVYPISVGREGFTWTGEEKVSRIADWPDWHPPAEMRQRDPRLPVKMYGGIRNPLGATAIFLGDTLYRIHGTNDPKTIGQAASSGCFRMLNGHAIHLASIVEVGATVKVLPHLNGLPDAAKAAALPVRNPTRTAG